MTGHRSWAEVSKAVRDRPGAAARIKAMEEEIRMNIAPARPYGDTLTTWSDAYGPPVYERIIHTGRISDGTYKTVVTYRAIGEVVTTVVDGPDGYTLSLIYVDHEEARRKVDSWADAVLDRLSRPTLAKAA